MYEVTVQCLKFSFTSHITLRLKMSSTTADGENEASLLYACHDVLVFDIPFIRSSHDCVFGCPRAFPYKCIITFVGCPTATSKYGLYSALCSLQSRDKIGIMFELRRIVYDV